jgi:hypothetical protein
MSCSTISIIHGNVGEWDSRIFEKHGYYTTYALLSHEQKSKLIYYIHNTYIAYAYGLSE